MRNFFWLFLVLAVSLLVGTGCRLFETEEEQKARQQMGEIFDLLLDDSEPIPPEDPDATYWFSDIGELTDEPVWQLTATDPTPLKVAEISEIDMPNPEEWTMFSSNGWPVYLSEEDGDLVLRGLHLTQHQLPLGLGTTDEIDGMQKWVIGDSQSEIYTFEIEQYGLGIVLGVNDPDNPGPEFLTNTQTTPDVKDALGRVTERGQREPMLFDQNANLITSITFPDKWHHASSNGFPIERNDAHRIFSDGAQMDSYHIEGPDGETQYVRDYFFLDVRGDTDFYRHPISGNPEVPDYIQSWVGSTMEIIHYGRCYPENYQLTVYSEDMDIFTTSLTEWPLYPDDETSIYIPDNHLFEWQNDRYFIFRGNYSGIYQHPEAPSILWRVKYNEGDDEMVPVWCRYEENIHHVTAEVLFLGPDSHPYMVRFSNISEQLKIIDLASGHLVVDIELDLTNWDEAETRPYHVIRLDQYNDIPVVVIFDKDAGHIVKIDLEIEN